MYIRGSNKHKIDFTDIKDTFSLSDSVSSRYALIFVAMILVMVFLFTNMFNLQIIEGSEYLAVASRVNRITLPLIPPRGLIYDSRGEKLAFNIPSYTLFVDTDEINPEQEQQLFQELANLLSLNYEDIWSTYQDKVYKEGQRLNPGRVTIKTNLAFDQYIDSVVVINSLEGVYIESETIRKYVEAPYFAHIIGYTGDPDAQDVDNGIHRLSVVGKTGIERQYDKILRGKVGWEVISSGVNGGEAFVPEEAEYGQNIYLTIDSVWQKKLTDIMQKQLGEVNAFGSAGVIMNARTGEVKALVSLPTYDNQLFVNGISYNDFSQLLNDPHTPLSNRVIGSQLPPGSIYKVVGALAGLENNIINRSTEYLSDRCMDLPGGVIFCEADAGYLGYVNIEEALAKSSNIFFCNLAINLNRQREGIYTQKKYADALGFGSRTGIDLVGEQTGTVASPEFKKQVWNEPWYIGDECNTIIGQGLVTVTPMQMVVAIAALNNNGDVVQPHLLDRTSDQSGALLTKVEPKVLRNIGVSAQSLNIIREGMRQAAGPGGTAYGLGELDQSVIAKTGSADAGEYIQGEYYQGAHSWVVGCFDYEGERYCFTILQQWGGRGYKTVPIMKKFINCVYNDFTQSCEAV